MTNVISVHMSLVASHMAKPESTGKEVHSSSREGEQIRLNNNTFHHTLPFWPHILAFLPLDKSDNSKFHLIGHQDFAIIFISGLDGAPLALEAKELKSQVYLSLHTCAMQRGGRDRTPTISTPMWKGEEWETQGRHWSTATLNSHWAGAEGALLTKDPCSVPCSPWPFAPLPGLLFPLSFSATCKRALKDFLSLGERAYFPDCFLAVEYVGPQVCNHSLLWPRLEVLW